MRQVLKLHSDGGCAAVTRITVDVDRPGPGRLDLRYTLAGAPGELLLPAAAASTRADELWRHTCLEAFVRGPAGDAYLELNFAPSTQWAAYRFDGYREAMRPADVGAPQVAVGATGGGFELTAAVELSHALDLPIDAPWRLGLSAVIEERGGRMSYWALAHPPGRPDFHHPDCFALELPAPERP